MDDVYIINPNQYKKVIEIYPILGDLYATMKEFLRLFILHIPNTWNNGSIINLKSLIHQNYGHM